MFSLREYREPSSRLPDRLPWACIVAPGVVLQKDAIFQRTIAFRGPDLASSLDSELIAASARLNNALRRLGSGWGLFVEAQRFLSSAYPAASWPDPAAAAVDRERRRAFEQAGAPRSLPTPRLRREQRARRRRPSFAACAPRSTNSRACPSCATSIGSRKPSSRYRNPLSRYPDKEPTNAPERSPLFSIP